MSSRSIQKEEIVYYLDRNNLFRVKTIFEDQAIHGVGVWLRD